jgi:DNA repair protein RAD16
MPAVAFSSTLNNSSGPSTVDGDDDSSDFPAIFMRSEYAAKMKVTTRASLSSVSTSTDYNESSGYTTPATSAFTTPAPTKTPAVSSPARRGRRPASKATEPANGVSAVARAAALRNSQFALHSTGSKRKKFVVSDDENSDDDNSPDAQLARALQKQEDAAAAKEPVMISNDSGSTHKKALRKARKIVPKADFYVSDFDDDSDEVGVEIAPSKLKVELGAKGSNAVSFSSKRKSNVVLDSDNSDDFIEIDDSEDDEPIVSMSTTRSRMKVNMSKQSKRFKSSQSSSRGSKEAPPAARGRSSVPFPKTIPLKRENTKASDASSALSSLLSDITESEFDTETLLASDLDSDVDSSSDTAAPTTRPAPVRNGPGARRRINNLEERETGRARKERARLELHHPELHTMWKDLENLPKIDATEIEQPATINRQLKPFQLEGVAWMKAMEKTDWGGGLLGDEMGMGKTIQAVSLIMSDFPAPQPTLVLIPPSALMQWEQEIRDYTDNTLKTFVYHGTNSLTKGATVRELMKYNVILMSYNSLESMYRKQEKGFKRKTGLHKEKSVIHQIHFHRVILDEAHSIKVSFSTLPSQSSLIVSRRAQLVLPRLVSHLRPIINGVYPARHYKTGLESCFRSSASLTFVLSPAISVSNAIVRNSIGK